MKSRNLLLGVILLIFGIIALLTTFDVINLQWNVIWKFWPMFLVIGGISALPINEYVKTALVLASFLAGFFLYQHEVTSPSYSNSVTSQHFSYNNDRDEYDEEATEESDEDFSEEDNTTAMPLKGEIRQSFSESYDKSVRQASVEIDFGAGELALLKPCRKLAFVTNESDFMDYRFKVEKLDGSANVIIEPKDKNHTIQGKVKNKLELALNDDPVWKFNIDMGATDFNFDFSPYKVSDIEINSGVCDMDIKLGEYEGNTNLKVSSGVSNINISVPQNVGCRIINDSAIVGKDFPGFSKVENGRYETNNFASARHQIIIELNCALSSLTVKRY